MLRVEKAVSVRGESGPGASPSESLRELVRRLWEAPAAGSVLVTFDDDPAPAGYRLAERLEVIPRTASARYLSPGGSARVAAGSMLSYNRMRSPRTMLGRVAVAATLLVGAGRPAGFGRMRVWISDPGGGEAPLLIEHLRELLDEPTLQAGVGVHALDPNWKPTLQLHDDRGRARGFAKIGWTAPTAELVLTEARALREMQHLRGPVRAPGLLATSAWRGMPVTVVQPLPAGARRVRDLQPPEAPAVLQVAGATATAPLGETSYWSRVRGAAAAVPWAALDADLGHAVEGYVTRLAEHESTVVATGRWHGDWVPWNLARCRSQLYAFDWEHSAQQVPLGFDLAHWSFQRCLVGEGGDLAQAVARADIETPQWPRAGVSVHGARLVVSLYVLEMALRTVRLRLDGGRWNPRIHAGLAALLRRRCEHLL